MLVRDGEVVLSASDLKAAVECEWATMRRLDGRLGRVEAVPDPDDAMNRRAAGLGDAHEHRQLQAYLERYGEHVPGRPGGVAVIPQVADRRDAAELAAARLGDGTTIRIAPEKEPRFLNRFEAARKVSSP